MNPREIAIRLATALLVGVVIGVERQWRQRMAGLRTNALVSIGAAGFVVFSTTVSGDNSPTRVAAQIVSGIGFLGAGVILREGINIRGLNTAATLWCSAMVGTFAGAGQLIASLLAGAFVVGTNLLLRRSSASSTDSRSAQLRWKPTMRSNCAAGGRKRRIFALCCSRLRQAPGWDFAG